MHLLPRAESAVHRSKQSERSTPVVGNCAITVGKSQSLIALDSVQMQGSGEQKQVGTSFMSAALLDLDAFWIHWICNHLDAALALQ